MLTTSSARASFMRKPTSMVLGLRALPPALDPASLARRNSAKNRPPRISTSPVAPLRTITLKGVAGLHANALERVAFLGVHRATLALPQRTLDPGRGRLRSLGLDSAASMVRLRFNFLGLAGASSVPER